MEYDVLLRARYMAPKRDPFSQEYSLVWKDEEQTLRVNVEEGVPRDLHAQRARELAGDTLRASLTGKSPRLSFHCVTPVGNGDCGNAGNPPDGVDAGRSPLKARRGDSARTQARRGGRFVAA